MSAAPIGVVSGSGMALERLLDTVEAELPFGQVPGMPTTHVAGHGGTFLRGTHGGRPLFLQCGRIHLYEGYSPAEVARGVDVMAGWGAGTVIFLNAVGGLQPHLKPGDLVACDEVWAWPFLRHAFPPVQRPDLVLPGCDHTGACVWMHGPCYETRAEVGLLRRSGAAVVGMSLVAELARCRELGLRSAVVCCVANQCGGSEPLSHTHVLENMHAAAARIRACISATLPAI
jgi:purine-nucleoside phosphorylase